MSDEGGFWERVLRRLGHEDLAAVARELTSLSTRRSRWRGNVLRLEKKRGLQDPLTRKLRAELTEIEQDHDAARRLLLGEPEPPKETYEQ